ncbi:Aste57867_3536 [Aphanomyces stellatus]|uniref:E3 ubiquitin-protein ligase n=1 Tax=Aphanomyces stellatus TaxID=120398 RepID=A0A485KAR8_9STRA|nr:hypothetical protein As57867_003525 [Aphanomyces stellatus]VFT80699.1 Aste57867_3536 [Aphanomyces stellatus]
MFSTNEPSTSRPQQRDLMAQQRALAGYPWIDAVRAAVENNPNAVRRKRMCGYEFRPGDMAWNCRQCQKDETCVLCHACFASSHAALDHDVTFYYTQQGTGCCDCGDDEAWDPAGFCAEHNPPADGDGDILSSVPTELLAPAQRDVAHDLDVLFRYAYGRRQGFQRVITKEDDGLFDLWLHVTEANIRSAPEKLTLVQGRISTDSVFHWLSTLDKSNVSLFNAGDPDVYADVLAIFGRLTHTTLACDVGCRLVAQQMSSHPTILGHLIRAEALFPQSEASALHTLIMSLLPDPAFKEAFAIAYTESYAFIFTEYLHGLGTQGQTILIFGVQFLNRASFVHKLMADHALLDVLLGAFEATLLEGSTPATAATNVNDDDDASIINQTHPWDAIARRMRDPWTSLDFAPLAPPVRISVDAPQFTSHRYIQVLMDLKYVFQIPHPRFLRQYGTKYKWFCRLLARLQGIGASARIPPTEQHVAMESRSWIGTLETLLLRLRLTTTTTLVCIEMTSMVEELVSALVVNVVTSSDEVFETTMEGLVAPLVEAFCMWLATTQTYFPRRLPLVGAKDVAVGAHFPLHHALLLILRACTRSQATMDTFDAVLNARMPHAATDDDVGVWHREMLAVPLVQALVWDAQVHVGMWKRNGWSVVNHSMNYGEPYYCMKFRDLDLLGVQFAFAVGGIDRVVALLLAQFDVAALDTPEFEDPMHAECLRVCCQVATELPHPDTSLAEPLRRVLLQRLCSKASTHSELFKAVSEFCAVHEVHAALAPIALDAAVKDLTKEWIIPNQKNYTLDPRHFELYDACTIHLTRKQHEAARMNRLESRMELFKKGRTQSMFYAAVPPPRHVASGLLYQFEPAYYMVLHPQLCDLVEKIVVRLDAVSTALSTMAVHLLTLQLYALRTALDHPTYQDMGQRYLTWLESVVPALTELNPWTVVDPPTTTRDNTDHERGRHIQWILHELSVYPSFHSIVYAPAQVASAPSSSESQPDSLRHRAQQLALLRMQQQQAAFADYLDENTSDGEDETSHMCAMCHTKESSDAAALCYIGFVHPSSLNVPSVHAKKTPWEDMKKEVPLTMQCCGHCVHMGCWESYYATQFQKVITGEAYLNAVDVKKGEFLCPLCKAISNVLVPVSAAPAPTAPHVGNIGTEFAWDQWLAALAPSEADPALSEGLAKLCMAIHRVATGAQEKAHPDRYVTTACHAVFTTRWTASQTHLPNAKIQPFVTAARHLRHASLSWQLRRLLATGHAVNESTATTLDTHTLTQVQKTWHSVVGAKPLLLHDLGSIVARGVLLSHTFDDAVCAMQLVALAFVVQTTLWLAANDDDNEWTTVEDDVATAWFLAQWCGGASKDQATATLLGLVEGAPWVVTDPSQLVARVALDVYPFCKETQAMIAPVHVTWLTLPQLPPSLLPLIRTWQHAFYNTYVGVWQYVIVSRYNEMDDPQGVLAQWQLKQNVVSWTPVLKQDLDTAHVPLSTIWLTRRTAFLRTLPASYNSLYLDLTKKVCPSCHMFPSRPALCLICGGLLCAASSCKSISPMSVSGACTLHAHKCGRGVGMFLLVLEGTVLLVCGKLAAFYGHGLYVDEYGEGFGETHSATTYNRGRPLFLQTHTRDQLLRLWTQQGVPHEIVQTQNIVTHIVPNSHY